MLLPRLKGAFTLMITITMIIYHFMLSGLYADGDFSFFLQNLILHYIVPSMVILDWILFDLKRTFHSLDPLYWLSIPILYSAFPLLYKGGKWINPQNTRQSLRLRHRRTDTASAFQPGKERIMNELTYERVGDYLLPCIRLSDTLDAPPLGRYGMMHKEYT